MSRVTCYKGGNGIAVIVLVYSMHLKITYLLSQNPFSISYIVRFPLSILLSPQTNF